ncbi:glycosyltransferase family 15 protein, partial [Pseudocercospora fijiensis CIRAD86]
STWTARAKDTQDSLSELPRNEPTSPKPTEQFILQSSSGRERMNATFVSLVRNSELSGMLHSIRDVEDRFNRNWNYDWVFLNDEEFTEEFKTIATAFTSGRAKFGRIHSEHWGFPAFINQTKAQEARKQMADLTYGDSASYRHMCRYQSGFFYQHPLVLEYEWYWRVEPSIQLFCDIDYDPFRLMAENGKKYGFVISINELKKTVPSLWGHVKDFMKAYPQHIVKDNHMGFLSEDGGET